MGQRSVLHAVKIRNFQKLTKRNLNPTFEEEENLGNSDIIQSKLLNDTLNDLQLKSDENPNSSITTRDNLKAQFFVYCSQCENLCAGKLRVRCSVCKGGAFTVHRDPENWEDVLKPKRITGHCDSLEKACVDNENNDPAFTEFYFKCAEHPSGGEQDFAAPLNLIKRNGRNVPCLACTEIW